MNIGPSYNAELDFPFIAFVETVGKSVYSYWPTSEMAQAAQSEMLHSVHADNVEEQSVAA